MENPFGTLVMREESCVVAFWVWSATGDRRQATGDRRQATGDRRQATGDRRQATGDYLA